MLVAVVASSDGDLSLLWNRHTGAQGVAADRAFLELTVPEERVRIALAKAGRAHAEHAMLRRFAARTVRCSRREMRKLLAFAGPIDADVPDGFTPPFEQGRADSGALGLVPFDAGLSVTSAGLLRGSNFEQEFINRMIRLDQGAVRTTRAVYSQGAVNRLKQLAVRILDQRFEDIFLLNGWYVRWFGRPSRAGGVPAGA